MNQEELKARTKTFALKVIKTIELLPHHRTAEVIGKQLLRSAMSVGANYRAACRARSSSISLQRWLKRLAFENDKMK